MARAGDGKSRGGKISGRSRPGAIFGTAGDGESFQKATRCGRQLRLEGDALRETTGGDGTEDRKRNPPGWSERAGNFKKTAKQMGALVTLRDLDSLESINTQLQVSERLAALGPHYSRRGRTK